MIHDYFAAQSYVSNFDHVQRQVIDYLTGGKTPLEEFGALGAIKDPTAMVELLALAQLSVKSYAQSGDPRSRTRGIRDAVDRLKDNFRNRLGRDLRSLDLLPQILAPEELSQLPRFSFTLQLRFKLRQPYLSRDDAGFYLLDNPIKKEKVFRLPYVAPPQWKGSLRSALTQCLTTNEERARLAKLFGPEKESFAAAEEKQEGFAGRLQFYPSFFTEIGYEVINPHTRKTGAGDKPILFECVPAGAEAEFVLLYVPHDLVGKPERARAEVSADLKLMAEGLEAMFDLYGFGAKTTSGFGRADLMAGSLAIRERIELPSAPPPAATQPAEPLAKYLEAPDRLKPEYRNPDGSFRERPEAELKKMGKMTRWEYDKARRWWLTRAAQAPPAPATEAKPTWPTAIFKSLAELSQLADRIARALERGGGQ